MNNGNSRTLLPPPAEGELIQLLPQELTTEARFNVRPYSARSAAEDKRIEKLAENIEQLGQQTPIKITPAHVIISGHRRRSAFLLINEKRARNGQGLLKINCLVDASNQDLRRKAIADNLHRKNPSAMDVCFLISEVKKEFGWEGENSVRLLANYFSLDPLSIRNYQCLHKAPKPLQDALDNDILSLESVLKILASLADPEAIPKVIERAAERQREDEVDRAVTRYREGKLSANEAVRKMKSPPDGRIKISHIADAIREHDQNVVIARKRKELLAGMGKLDCDEIPIPGRIFVRYYIQDFASGNGDLAKLKAKFKACFTS